jgi:subtilisin family serine protease
MKILTFRMLAVTLAVVVAIVLAGHSRGDGLNKSKSTPRLAERVTTTSPQELITVMVAMEQRPNLDAVRGDRNAVLRELKRHASQCEDLVKLLLSQEIAAGEARIVATGPITGNVAVAATPRAIKKLTRQNEVKYVSENIVLGGDEDDKKIVPGIQLGPGDEECDPNQVQLWDNIGKVGAKTVWNTYGITGDGVRTGAIDKHIDPDHPDFSSKIDNVADFDSLGNPLEATLPGDAFHGMHVVGTIIGGNSSGYDIGMAPGATHNHANFEYDNATHMYAVGYEKMCVWLMDPNGDDDTSDGADVINMSVSLARARDLPGLAPWYQWHYVAGASLADYISLYLPTINWVSDILDAMLALDVVPCIALGNAGPGPYTSTAGANSWPTSFSVGNVDSTDTIWEGDSLITVGSSWGPVLWPGDTLSVIDSDRYGWMAGQERWLKPDIVAPGTMIYSSQPNDSWAWQYQGGFTCAHWTGTSMATPHVTGAVALMLEANPDLPPNETMDILRETAVPLGVAGPDSIYGYGRLDAFAAVTMALGVTVTTNAEYPDSFLRTCPSDTAAHDGADAVDALVVTIEFPTTLSVDSIPASLITLELPDPDSTDVVLWSDGAIQADSAAVAPGYTTTITHKYISGCSGATPTKCRVMVDGAPLSEQAEFYVRSFDVSPSAELDGWVELADFATFGLSWGKCPDSSGYNACVNWVVGGGSECVELADYAEFSLHLHHKYVGSGGGSSPVVSVVASGAEVVLGLDEKGRGVKVELVGGEDIRALSVELDGLVLPKRAFEWKPAEGVLLGQAFRSETSGNVVVLAASGSEPLGRERIELGTLVFEGDEELSAEALTGAVAHGEAINASGERLRLNGAHEAEAPKGYENRLGQNYPNPFNPVTVIEYSISRTVPVRLEIYDVAGRLVRTLVDERQRPDAYRVPWDGKDNDDRPVASGVYFYRLEAGDFVQSKKLVLLK